MKKCIEILNFILDFLFPTGAAESIPAETLSKKIARKRRRETVKIPNTIVLFDYRDILIKKLIWQLKYKGSKKVAKVFAEVLDEYLLEELAELNMFSSFENPLLIPIPLSKIRMRERGFNQSQRVAQELSERMPILKLETGVFARVKDTPSQTSLHGKNMRMESIKGAFAVSDPQKIKGQDVILLDDVITTGSTMNEARHTLLSAGARKVMCVALAH
ncbi:ComF family protein [Patescibacteria group bacterium]|nr:ComF family protein [Patescibacteria group bacterium]